MSAQEATLRDVARAAGCSLSTASVALSGRGPVAEATARRVRGVAAELGYRPDPLRAQLAATRFRRVRGLLPVAFLRWRRRTTLYEGFLREMLPAAGYECRVIDVDMRSDLAAMPGRLIDSGVAALIIHRRVAFERPAACRLDWPGLAVVVAATVGPDCPYTSHDIAVYEQWLLAWAQAVEAGYRRIGACCLHSPQLQHEEQLRLAACAFAQQQHPLPRLPVFRDALRFDPRRFEAWLHRRRPQVLISNLPIPGRQRGDLPLICAGGNRPPPTQKLAHVGPEDEQRCREVVALIDRLLRERQLGPLRNPQRITVSPAWYPGPSLPCV